MIRKIRIIIRDGLIEWCPKKEQILLFDPFSLSANILELADYLVANVDLPIIYAVSKKQVAVAKKFMPASVKIIELEKKWQFKWAYLSSKYFFTAQFSYPQYSSSKQTIVNIWHGVPYKKLGMLKDNPSKGLKADMTVATSPRIQKIMAQVFGVPEESCIITGYPRNDILMRINREKDRWRQEKLQSFQAFDRIVLWLPTYRVDTKVSGRSVNGIPTDSVFQIEDFDVDHFNQLLQAHNTLCLVKPHPFSAQPEAAHLKSNIYIVDDQWLWERKFTVYHLAACSDILISDVSSIIIDYLHVNHPIISFFPDYEVYKQNRGFVFSNLEEWMPTKILKTQEAFFAHLGEVLENRGDDYEAKRLALRKEFFSHHDEGSAKRIVDYVFHRTQG